MAADDRRRGAAMALNLNLKLLRKWVEECGSTAEAARRLDMKRPNLVRLLKGRNADIRISTLGHLAGTMGIEPAELLGLAAS